jgi:hypothetical protein
MDGGKTKGSISCKGRNIFPFYALSVSAVVPTLISYRTRTVVERPLLVVVLVDTIQMSYAFDKRSGAVCKRQVRHQDLFCSRSADAVALLCIIRSGCADSDSIVPSSKSSCALFFLYASYRSVLSG